MASSVQVMTRQFVEQDGGEECLVIVRTGPGWVALALSRRSDGDVEVFMPPTEVEALVSALQQALLAVE